MPHRLTVVEGEAGATIAEFAPYAEFDPATLGAGMAGIAETTIVLTTPDGSASYRVTGFNHGNGYLKAEKLSDAGQGELVRGTGSEATP